VYSNIPVYTYTQTEKWVKFGHVRFLAKYKLAVYKYYDENDARLCCLVARVCGYTTEMYCVSCEVRTEFIYVM
jgi:hypothetical protein